MIFSPSKYFLGEYPLREKMLTALTSHFLFVCLFVCFQAYVRHPEVASAKANRDFVMKQMSEAVNAISGATQATGTKGPHPLEAPGALATALDDFDVSKSKRRAAQENTVRLLLSH